MNVNLEYYKIFYYVAKTGSFTAAAKKLCITQPAISQAIKSLENILGSDLFVRTKKGVNLTPEGEKLFSYVSYGYENILLGEAKFKKMVDLESGEIRIGASDMTLEFYLLTYLEAFHKKYPQIKISVTNAPTPKTLQYLYDGKIDFGVVSDPLSASIDTEVTKVRQIQDVFIAGKQYEYLKGKELDYSELNNLSLICLEKKTSTRAYVDQYLYSKGVVMEPEFELATSGMIVGFTLRNLGIGSVIRDFAKSYLDRGELFELKFKESIPRRNFCIIKCLNNPISTAGKKLLDMIEEDTYR